VGADLPPKAPLLDGVCGRALRARYELFTVVLEILAAVVEGRRTAQRRESVLAAAGV